MMNIRLLVVDDNALNVKLMQLLLPSDQYDVRTAASAERAQEIMEAFRPDLILLDVQLPGMDGLQFARMLKDNSATKDIVIVAVTAFAMKGDEEKSMAAGCDGYIAKPIDTRSFVPTLMRFLRNKSSF